VTDSDPLQNLTEALASSYRVERPLGEGGMATVYLATDLKHHRPVAIKVLRPELAQSIGPERFLREIEIAARLQHPNILPLHDSGEVDGFLYYVMPYIEGESLRDRIMRSGAIPRPEALRIAREVADALDYAHRQGIVHRDIKPGNILLSQGHAVVADFGIARAVSASASGGLTQVGIAVGSPAYMSPEQALGSSEVDARSDVFALGVVLFEMLDGHPPFEGTTPQAIVTQSLTGKARKLPKVSSPLQPIVDKALAREPKDRFASAAEMATALDASATGAQPAFASPTRRRQFMIGGAIAVAAALAVAFWPRGDDIGDPRQSLIIFPFENRTGDASRSYLSEASMNLLGLAASHWRDLRVFDDERTASLMRRRQIEATADLDFEEARAMAREARVGTMVIGDIRLEGDSMAIEAKVHDVSSGDRLQTRVVRAGRNDDPRPKFDELAGLILGTDGAPPGERPSLLAQTTTSLEAYRAYLAGSAALQRFETDSAKVYLDRAVAIDSNFALAYLRLRDVAGWSLQAGDPAARRRYVMAAERSSGSLPPRLKQLVAFHRAYEDGNFRRARGIVSDLINRDSTDVEAWYQLGEATYHDRANSYPHPDTAGNLGIALKVFQHTLALDSSYVLAYQHILDALNSCATGQVWACLPDSAVYGEPDSLVRRYGEATLKRARDEAVAATIETARGWVSAVPNTPRARYALVSVLYGQAMYAEGDREADMLAQIGSPASAGLLKGRAILARGDPGRAAKLYDSLLALAADSLPIVNNGNDITGGIVLLAGGGGRLDAAGRLNRAWLGNIPVDSGVGPANLRMSKAELIQSIDALVAVEAGLSDATGMRNEFQRIVARNAGRDTAAVRRFMTSLATSYLSTFLATRDSTILKTILATVDTTNSTTWHSADAQLALLRGDTARARMRVERHYRRPEQVELRGDNGAIRTYAWADVLSRLGETAAAIHAFALLDSADRSVPHPGLQVRSWAERGALYQRLGDAAKAEEFYRKFIDAWQYADTSLQPAVERARAALEALPNAAPVLPRRPG
jgi:serine/threonine-protein kinase